MLNNSIYKISKPILITMEICKQYSIPNTNLINIKDI